MSWTAASASDAGRLSLGRDASFHDVPFQRMTAGRLPLAPAAQTSPALYASTARAGAGSATLFQEDPFQCLAEAEERPTAQMSFAAVPSASAAKNPLPSDLVVHAWPFHREALLPPKTQTLL